MRGLIDELQGALTWFTQEQHDHFAFCVACEDPDIIILQGVLNGLEQVHRPSHYLTFFHEARTARAWVDVAIELMNSRMDAINAERAERDREPIPHCPIECYDAELAPSRRVQLLIEWWRGGMLDPEIPIVLSILPTRIPDPEAYRELVWGLLPFEELAPWMRHGRLIVRDRRDGPLLEPHFAEHRVTATASYTADFSPKACEEALGYDAGNPQLSARDRGMAMLQLAALDYAHQRFEPAMDKYGRLANLFMELEEKGLLALCLCGAGDIHKRVGQLEEARKRYAQGVDHALAAEAKPVLLNCLIGLGQTTALMGEHAQSETSWDTAARVAGSMGNRFAVADAVTELGTERLEQGRPTDAWKAWQRVLEYIDEEQPYLAREADLLQRMVDCAKDQRWTEQERELAPRLAIAKAKLEQEVGAQ